MKKLVLSGKRIITGEGSLKALEELECDSVFIVTGGGSMMRSGVIDRAKSYLEEKGTVTYVYSGVQKNPSTLDVKKGLEFCRSFHPDCILAIGGGSAIDCAKAILLFYEYPFLNFENVLDYNVKGEIPTVRDTKLCRTPDDASGHNP